MTVQGAKFYRVATELYDCAAGVIRPTARFRRLQQRVLKIGYGNSYASVRFHSEANLASHERLSEWTLEDRNVDDEEGLAMLLTGELDLVVLSGRDSLRMAEHHHAAIFPFSISVDWGVLFHGQHPIANEPAVDRHHLDRYPLLLPEPSYLHEFKLDSPFWKEAPVIGQSEHETSYYHSILEVVGQTGSASFSLGLVPLPLTINIPETRKIAPIASNHLPQQIEGWIAGIPHPFQDSLTYDPVADENLLAALCQLH